MKDFIHLHVHSEYSLLDGYATVKAIVGRAAELGMDSIALTDHGVMYGAVDFYEAAQKAGIKPVLGVEAYLVDGSHTEKSDGYYHQLLLAKNVTGYRNLVRLTTRAHLDGFWKKPRIDRALLEEHHEGIVATSSCLAGEIPQAIMKGTDGKQVRELAAYYRDLFGPENYYLELQLHDNAPELPRVNDELVRIGKELGIPLVATNDTHFVRREDLETQKLVMAMGFNTTLTELCSKNYIMDESYHIMSGEEMWQRFKQYGTDPLENTRRIADMCHLDLDFGRVQLPAFEIPAGHDAASYLRLICEEGLMRRCDGNPPLEYVKRLDYELDVINQTGFPDYMLIVWDYVKYARNRGIPCLPRGSAGASLVLYCLGITDVDPVENKLLFERFLSPERLEMPDIDTDFADSRRHEVIEYIANKYGRDNTAQIITYGTLGAKAALRDVGRVLDVPLSEVDRVAKLIPGLPVGVTIAQALERVPELRQMREQDPQLRAVIDRAQLVEGRMRHVGTHACGVVVSRDRLDALVPLQHTTRDEEAVMASYEGPTLAKVGLLKMDILGLTNLSVVAEALNYIQQTTGQQMELSDIPLDDARTFESLSRGETVNVFQLESVGMTRYLKGLKPARVQDLYAMVALYRPGPLEQIPLYIHNKNNPQDISYLHPILKPILEDTYGVIVYQEQIMQLLQAIAGYTLGRAYVVLKAIGKKKKDLMAQEEPKFKEGCLKNGLTQEQADTLWDLIQPFAGYSFNRPHSTLYGLLSYQTAYLKVNYPAQYMAAVLDASRDSIDDVAKAINESVRLGVVVQPPDINHSNAGFSLERLPESYVSANGTQEFAIRFGLSAIKGVGGGPVESIIAAREQGGPFASLEDFCARVDRHALNKRVLEALVKCGAMVSLPGSRHQQVEMLEATLAAGIEAQKAREAGQTSLFDLFGDSAGGSTDVSVSAIPLPAIQETPDQPKQILAWEKELLGIYISAHPIAQALTGLDTSHTLPIRDAAEHMGESHTFIGMITGVRRISTKKGDPMMVAVLEDLESSIEMVVFPRVLEKHADLLQEEAVLCITARVDNRRDSLQLVVEQCAEVQPLAAPAEGDDVPDAVQPEVDIEDIESLDRAPESVEPPAPSVPPIVPTASEPVPPTELEPMPSAPLAADIPTVEGPVRAIRQRPRRVSLAANGNGNGNGSSDQPSANGSSPEHSSPNGYAEERNGHTSGPLRDLRLRLPRTSNLHTDTRCMQDVHELLRANEGGESDYQITLYVPLDLGTVVLRPHYHVRTSSGLLNELRRFLGEDAVEVAAE